MRVWSAGDEKDAGLALLAGACGHRSKAAGAGTVAWMQGRLDAALDANFDQAEKAAKGGE